MANTELAATPTSNSDRLDTEKPHMFDMEEAHPDLLPEELLAGCQRVQEDNSHESFCFELFRRAIAAKSEVCWSLIYQQYQRLVYRWVLDCANGRDHIGDLSVDDMVLHAFTSFWRAFTSDKLAKAPALSSVLSYLKSCAGTAVLQAKRQLESKVTRAHWQESEWAEYLEGDDQNAQPTMNPEVTTLAKMGAEELWTIVDSCCVDERERMVARLSFVSNLKPRAIIDLMPDQFSAETEIYSLRRNLKNRLARNEQLQILAERGST